MEAIQVLNLLPENKNQLDIFCLKVKRDILNDSKPLRIAKILKSFEDLISFLRKDEEIKEMILKELEKYPEKTIEIDGAEITKKSMTKYVYEDNQQWNEINKEIEKLKTKQKELEKLLQVLKEPAAFVEGGEIINPVPKFITDTFAVKLK